MNFISRVTALCFMGMVFSSLCGCATTGSGTTVQGPDSPQQQNIQQN